MIRYREGYKYQLAADYSLLTPVLPPAEISHEFFTLGADGQLTIRAGYAWDGASGPTIDTKSSMRPSLVHDCFCQLLQARLLDYDLYAEHIHKFFHELCLEDGMWSWRAKIWHWAVMAAKGGHPDNQDDNPVLEAP
jgi:hypothetical protein